MSIEIIKSQIFSFLKSDTPEVMAIRGKWGVGKTFFWKRVLEEAQKMGLIKFKKYSYVSLFGVNTLEKMKFSIFEQVIDKSLIGIEPSVDTFKTNADTLLKSLGRKSLPFIQGFPVVKNFETAIESISFLSLRNILICIDDFERKGDSLSAKEVLGLISILKEQKFCKVVLIFNDEFFDEKAKDDYTLLREKCIDLELMFNPSATECASIALPGSDDVSIKLRELIIKLGINSIRIIKKIERVANILKNSLSKFEVEVLSQALHSLCLFSWCYYTDNSISPDFNYVRNIGNKMFYAFNGKENETDEEKQWKAILRRYDYQTTEDLDIIIADTVETGFLNNQNILLVANNLNDQLIATKSENKFRDAWNIYNYSFENNEEELIRTMQEAILNHSKYIKPSGLDAGIRLLRDLDQNKLADKLIDHYIQTRKDEIEIFNLNKYPFESGILDTKLRAEFQRIYDSRRQRPTIEDVLKRISDKDGWNMEDEEVLANATIEEFYELFKKVKGEYLFIYIDKCLHFGRFVYPSEAMKKIADNAKKALEKIANENRLNAKRVSKFGIKVLKDSK